MLAEAARPLPSVKPPVSVDDAEHASALAAGVGARYGETECVEEHLVRVSTAISSPCSCTLNFTTRRRSPVRTTDRTWFRDEASPRRPRSVAQRVPNTSTNAPNARAGCTGDRSAESTRYCP